MLVETYKLCNFRSVFVITQMKDGCIYKTRELGHIPKDEVDKYPPDKYVVGSVSTRYMTGSIVDLPMVSELNL